MSGSPSDAIRTATTAYVPPESYGANPPPDYRRPRGSSPAEELIAQASDRIARASERTCDVLYRQCGLLEALVAGQNEIVSKALVQSQVAALKAAKWEEHAIRLQGELDELRVKDSDGDH